MLGRIGRLLAALLVLNLAACGLLDLALFPVKLLFDLLGGAASAVGLAYATPVDGPAPVVQDQGGGRWVVTGLRPEAPFTIVCTSPGCETREFAWPADFAGRGEHVVVSFERSR